MADSKNIDKIAVIGLWILIVFGILQSTLYFQPPTSYLLIVAVTVGFAISWIAYAKGATREMIPRRRFWKRVLLDTVLIVFGVLAIFINSILFTSVVAVVQNNKLTLEAMGFQFGNILTIILLIGLMGLLFAGTFLFFSDAIGDITGEWRLVIRNRKRIAKAKAERLKEAETARDHAEAERQRIEDERIERIISGVVRRLREPEPEAQEVEGRNKWLTIIQNASHEKETES